MQFKTREKELSISYILTGFLICLSLYIISVLIQYTLQSSNIAAALILWVFAGVFITIGVACSVRFTLDVRYTNELIQSDKYVVCTDFEHETVVRTIDLNNYTDENYVPRKVTNTYAYAICRYTDSSGVVYSFKSLEYKLEKYPYSDGRQEIYVFVDLDKNPEKYYVYPY